MIILYKINRDVCISGIFSLFESSSYLSAPRCVTPSCMIMDKILTVILNVLNSVEIIFIYHSYSSSSGTKYFFLPFIYLLFSLLVFHHISTAKGLFFSNYMKKTVSTVFTPFSTFYHKLNCNSP